MAGNILKSKLVQQADYYPYGMPHSDAVGANNGRRKFGAKELMTEFGINMYDFEARFLGLPIPAFQSPDPLAYKTPHVSPYSYCNGDPVNNIDPTGCIIEGASKSDVVRAVEDLRAMFIGEVFQRFRDLIVQSGKKQNGKSIAPISGEALSAAFNGITLNEDQHALVDMVVNTINSKDVHKVEYVKKGGVLSRQAERAFLPGLRSGRWGPYISSFMEKNGGIPDWIIESEGGSGLSTPVKGGSYSLIILGGVHPNGRAVTTGHEIIGHGRSFAVDLGEIFQHVQAVRTENLILRVMGIPFVNTGIEHGPKTPVKNPSLLPSFR